MTTQVIDSGFITAESSYLNTVESYADLFLSPGTGGKLLIDGFEWPAADGGFGHVLITNGAGGLEFASLPDALTVVRTEVSQSGSVAAATDTVAVTAACSLTLPPPSDRVGKPILFAKEASGTFAVTILPHANEKISGATSATLSAEYESVSLYSNGVNWYIC
jgi:hypothetical protein